MSTFKDMIRKVKSEIQEVSPEEASARAEKAVFVDVREADEWEKGHVPGALFIPRGFLELRIEEQVPDKQSEVIVYCAGGTRSALGARSLQDLGYTNVRSMTGGFGRWKESGLGVRVPKVLTAEQKERYSRHIKVPEVGEAGQTRLLESKVLLVGAGGLGCPAGLYLAAAGVGTLGIADFDVVDLSNLQRQVLHTNDSVGTPKTESAEKRIRALNPDVKVVRHDERLESSNVMDILAPYDVDHRRLRQLLDQIPDQRRGGARGQDQRLRQHLPLRGAGLGLRPAPGAVLPVPVPRADARRRWRPPATRRACWACCPAWSA